MKSYTASLINAVLLIILGTWGYFASDNPSFTALIPVVAGVILILLNKGIRASNKLIGHIAVLVTLIMLIGLIKPLTGALERDDIMAILRVIIMIASTLFALLIFIKDFIQVRKAK